MAQTYHETIRAVCRRRIAALPLSRQLPARLESHVVQLVKRNLANGRVERFARHRAGANPVSTADYVDRVLHYFLAEHAHITLLERNDTVAWEQLRHQLEQRAYRMILRLHDVRTASQQASEFANETCRIIFEKSYPFDISFDAWATTILNRLILARFTRSTDALDRYGKPKSLDDPPKSDELSQNPLGELLPDEKASAPFEKIENQSLLLDAIARLRSPQQRKVIQFTFLDELDGDTIAKRMGKSKQSIYTLRNRALKQLKNILTDTRKTKPSKSIK